MNIVTRTEWGAAPPKQTRSWSYGKRGVVLHWTHKPDVASWMSDESMRAIQRYHMRGVGFDIFYNFVVAPDGDVYEGRGWYVRGGAQGVASSDRVDLSIAAIYGADDVEPPPVAQVDAIRDLIREARSKGWNKTRPTGHRDWKTKPCPGDWYYEWLLRDGWAEPPMAGWRKPGDPVVTDDDVERVWQYMTGQPFPGPRLAAGWLGDALMRHDARIRDLENRSD